MRNEEFEMGGYMPMEIAGSEIGESLKKAGYTTAALAAPKSTWREPRPSREPGFNGVGSFLPPECRDDLTASIERLRQVDGPPDEPEAPRTRSGKAMHKCKCDGEVCMCDHPAGHGVKIITTPQGESIMVDGGEGYFKRMVEKYNREHGFA